MDLHAGWDVAWKETSIIVRQNRKRICRGKCLSDPQLVAEMIRKHASYAVLAVFETGPLATWFHRQPADGLPAVCIAARHAKAAHDTAPSKTGGNRRRWLSLLCPGRFLPGGARQEPCGDAGGAIRTSDANGMFPFLQPVPAPLHIALERILLELTWIGRFDYI